MNRLILAALALTLAGYGPTPDTQMRTESPHTYDQPNEHVPAYAPEVPGERVTVTRIGVFGDDLAYGERRGIYVIRDNETGKEFIGISGIGISERGSHSNGKTSSSDER